MGVFIDIIDDLILKRENNDQWEKGGRKGGS
jgi:hypothetical protein